MASDLLRRLNAEMAEVVAEAGRSLVRLQSGGPGAGAGTIVHSQGLIVTSAHVIGRGPVNVRLPDGTALLARLLASDPERDLAALCVDGSGLRAMEFGNSRGLRPGQPVFALGHPWGVPGAAAAGAVIAVGPDGLHGPHEGQEWVITSLRLRPGNSGGPVVDVHGRLVGVSAMVAGSQVGLAVPVSAVKDFLSRELGVKRV